jgi:sugar phosphate permease
MKADSRLTAARSTVVALLVLLFAITYLDRVCISVAGPRMQEDLHLNLIQWGWVTGVFTLSTASSKFQLER